MNFLFSCFHIHKTSFEKECDDHFKEVIEATKKFYEYYSDIISDIESDQPVKIDKEYLKQFRQYIDEKIREFQKTNDATLNSDAFLLSNFLNGLDDTFLYKYLRTDHLEYVRDKSFTKEIAYICTYFQKRIKNEIDTGIDVEKKRETSFLKSE